MSNSSNLPFEPPPIEPESAIPSGSKLSGSIKPDPTKPPRRRKNVIFPYRPHSVSFPDKARTRRTKTNTFRIGDIVTWRERIKCSLYSPLQDRTRTTEARISDISITPMKHRTLHLTVISSSGFKALTPNQPIFRRESVILKSLIEPR